MNAKQRRQLKREWPYACTVKFTWRYRDIIDDIVKKYKFKTVVSSDYAHYTIRFHKYDDLVMFKLVFSGQTSVCL